MANPITMFINSVRHLIKLRREVKELRRQLANGRVVLS